MTFGTFFFRTVWGNKSMSIWLSIKNLEKSDFMQHMVIQALLSFVREMICRFHLYLAAILGRKVWAKFPVQEVFHLLWISTLQPPYLSNSRGQYPTTSHMCLLHKSITPVRLSFLKNVWLFIGHKNSVSCLGIGIHNTNTEYGRWTAGAKSTEQCGQNSKVTACDSHHCSQFCL